MSLIPPASRITFLFLSSASASGPGGPPLPRCRTASGRAPDAFFDARRRRARRCAPTWGRVASSPAAGLVGSAVSAAAPAGGGASPGRFASGGGGSGGVRRAAWRPRARRRRAGASPGSVVSPAGAPTAASALPPAALDAGSDAVALRRGLAAAARENVGEAARGRLRSCPSRRPRRRRRRRRPPAARPARPRRRHRRLRGRDRRARARASGLGGATGASRRRLRRRGAGAPAGGAAAGRRGRRGGRRSRGGCDRRRGGGIRGRWGIARKGRVAASADRRTRGRRSGARRARPRPDPRTAFWAASGEFSLAIFLAASCAASACRPRVLGAGGVLRAAAFAALSAGRGLGRRASLAPLSAAPPARRAAAPPRAAPRPQRRHRRRGTGHRVAALGQPVRPTARRRRRDRAAAAATAAGAPSRFEDRRQVHAREHVGDLARDLLEVRQDVLGELVDPDALHGGGHHHAREARLGLAHVERVHRLAGAERHLLRQARPAPPRGTRPPGRGGSARGTPDRRAGARSAWRRRRLQRGHQLHGSAPTAACRARRSPAGRTRPRASPSRRRRPAWCRAICEEDLLVAQRHADREARRQHRPAEPDRAVAREHRRVRRRAAAAQPPRELLLRAPPQPRLVEPSTRMW